MALSIPPYPSARAPEPAEDASLLAQLRQRNGRAFDAIYHRYHERLWRFLVRLSGSAPLAEDLFQDTWLAVARHAAHLADDTDFAAWLFTIARNRYRSHRRWSFVDRIRREWLRHEPRALPSSTAEPEPLAVARAETVRLERALAELEPIHREVLLLVAVENLTTDQVAQVLGLRPEAVRKRLSRARAALASLLEGPPHHEHPRHGKRSQRSKRSAGRA